MSVCPIFKNLSLKEEAEFRQSARENYKPLTEISGVWHPVYQDECVIMNREYGMVPSHTFKTLL
jgi:hypothetical protein